MLKERENTFNKIQRFTDALCIFASWMLAYYLRFNYLPRAQEDLLYDFTILGAVLALASLFIFDKFNLYNSWRFSSKFDEFLTSIKANFTVFLFLIISLYFFRAEKISRIHLGIYLIISSLCLLALRISMRNFLRMLRKKGKNLRNILLVGNGVNLTSFIKNVKKFKDSGVNLVGWLDSGDQSFENVESLEQSYEEIISTHDIDGVFVSYQGDQSEKLNNFLKTNYNDIIPINILPDVTYSLVGHKINDFNGIPILSFNQPSISSIHLFLKRLMDITICLISFPVLFPLCFILGVFVKLSSPGPIFYGQERVTNDGKLFKMWKFRTMKMASNNEDKNTWSSKEEVRKTKFGTFLRKTSLDELPQLWNVFIGNMTIVGPRPERPFFVDKFKNEIPNYMLRHKMKAGITGWAQVNGWRGDTDLTKRIECDLFYIRNWSIWLDIKIIFLTFIKGLINKNAY